MPCIYTLHVLGLNELPSHYHVESGGPWLLPLSWNFLYHVIFIFRQPPRGLLHTLGNVD